MKIQKKYIIQKNVLIDFSKYKNKYLSPNFFKSKVLSRFTSRQSIKIDSFKQTNMQENTIQIIGSTEVIDNWGRQNNHDAKETYRILITPEEWTDDLMFFDIQNKSYDIDDLIGKKVQVGPFIFTVQDDME